MPDCRILVRVIDNLLRSQIRKVAQMGPSAKIESIISYRNAKILASFFVFFHLALVFLFRDNLPFRSELSDIFTPIVCIFGAGGLIYALLQAGDQKKKIQIALILMASGMLFYALAEIVWSILEVGFHQQPFPSLADGFYLMFYPLFTIGLIFLPSEQFSIREWYRTVSYTHLTLPTILLV